MQLGTAFNRFSRLRRPKKILPDQNMVPADQAPKAADMLLTNDLDGPRNGRNRVRKQRNAGIEKVLY